MFNVLPEILKKQIKSEYGLRRLIIIAGAVLFIQISFLILVLPSWMAGLRMEKELTKEVEESQAKLAMRDADKTMSLVADTNRTMLLLNSALKARAAVPAIDAILSHKKSSIHIDRILYVMSSPEKSVVTLSGMADTRESLVSFVKDLKNSGTFGSVDLPISNLAKDSDISFSINLTLQ